MSAPLAEWDNNDSAHERLVWWTRIDGRFQVEVQRTDTHMGELVVYDHQNGDKELLREAVVLSYGAVLGPDADDVAAWQERAIDFVDNELSEK